MVGVAGKSKACSDCKTRRVKCGFERPGCLRCAKAHIQCSGYDQEVFFVNRTLANPTVSAPIVLARTRAKRPRLNLIQEELNNLVELAKTSSTSPSLFRQAAFDLIQKLYLPRPGYAEDIQSSGHPFSWIRAVCELQDVCPVLDHSLIAFCTAQVYVTGTGSVTHDQSVERYHNALEGLSSVLTLDGDDRLDYLIASIVVLSTCELFICPTDAGWRIHVKGIADVLRLRRDSRRIPARLWTSLCSRLRVICVLSQLTRREQGPLTRAEWTKLMPHHSDTEPLDQLMNIACELPGTLEEAAKLLTTEHSHDSETTTIITALWTILKDIYTSQVELHATSSAPLYTAVPSKLTNPSDAPHETKLFPFALTFHSLQITSYFVVAWAIQLQILSTLLCLSYQKASSETLIIPPQFNDLHKTLGNIHDEAIKLARYLCQSIEYCHRTEMGTVGAQLMLYSQWIMHYFFTRFGTEREREWCRNIRNMNGIGARCNIRMMSFEG